MRGQVSYLDYYSPTNVFSLGTPNTTLLFSASWLSTSNRWTASNGEQL